MRLHGLAAIYLAYGALQVIIPSTGEIPAHVLDGRFGVSDVSSGKNNFYFR
jgi:hypothetical protein